MQEYIEFCKKYPLVSSKICDTEFTYRYYNNEKASDTIVLLVGGIGLSDLIYTHFAKFTNNFSVITFDYSIAYNSNEQLAKAISNLLTTLNIKAWFVGQSLGGIVAQLIAQRYPAVTKGLVLSNTGCLSAGLSSGAYSSLMTMLKSTKKSRMILRLVPFSLFKKAVTKSIFDRYAKQFSAKEKQLLGNVCNIMEQKLTKPYELHMLNLLIDLKKHMGMKKSQFSYLGDNVLLLLSQDDQTFNDETKAALIDLMPSPTVITDLKGGHLSLMVNCDSYVEIIEKFISNHK